MCCVEDVCQGSGYKSGNEELAKGLKGYEVTGYVWRCNGGGYSRRCVESMNEGEIMNDDWSKDRG